jgi:hypothetical protein
MAHQGWDALTIDHILDRARAHALVAGIHNGAQQVVGAMRAEAKPAAAGDGTY